MIRSLWTAANRFVAPTLVRTSLRLKRTYLDPSVQMAGWRHVSIGSSCVVSEGTWFNVNHPYGPKRIIIGDNSHIGRRNFFSAGPVITLGDYFFSGVDCRFLGCGHTIDDPRVPYRASGVTAGAPIDIEANCWLTTAVTVMAGVRIGRGSTIGAGSLVNHDVPPFSVAVGSPCSVIRRYDFRANAWVDAAQWVDSAEAFQPTEPEFIALLRERHATLPLALASASTRYGWL